MDRNKVAEFIEKATTYDTISGPYVEKSLDEFKFAELIVKDCILTIQMKIVRNGSTPENLRSYQHIEDIAAKYGISLPIENYGA